jgi:predicted lipase
MNFKRFNRRQLLWSGLGASIAAAVGRDRVRRQNQTQEQAALEALAEEQFDPNERLEAAYRSDLESTLEFANIQDNVKLKSPTIPYSREWSKLLIKANKLSTQQYLRGRFQSSYLGQVDVLPLYEDGFTDFLQVSSFRAAERVTEQFNVEIPISELAQAGNDLLAIQEQLEQTSSDLEEQIQNALKVSRRIPVYYGFLLTSPEINLLVFRGTQRRIEILGDIVVFQKDYIDPVENRVLGRAHAGFMSLYEDLLLKSVRTEVQKLDPKKPLVISGHSLGAAMAVFAAIDLALNFSELKPQIQLYTYAAPRIGNAEFVEQHNQLIPNHYRVVHLADMIPMLPLTKLARDNFVHGGEQWSFLSQQGDFLPNHIIETYRVAIAQEAEKRDEVGFNNLRLNLE